MSFLNKAKKADLLVLAEEFGQEVPKEARKLEIIRLITNNEEYQEDVARDLLSAIAEEEEKEREREKEREEKLREREREERKRELDHQLKLEELKLKHASEEKSKAKEKGNSGFSNPNEGVIKYIGLMKDQLPRVPQKTENWVFFFHQAETLFDIYEVPEEFRGKIILYRLADLIRSLTNSLGIEKLTSYKDIKECILAENRLTPLQYKRNFENCGKRVDESYIQWAARVKTNLDYYLQSREIKDLQGLKELIVADHMRDSLAPQVKSHILIKEGLNWLKPTELANEIDLYMEAQGKPNFYRGAREDRGRNFKVDRDEREKFENKFKSNDKDKERTMNDKDREKNEYKRKEKPAIRCFECNEIGHYRFACSKLKMKKEKEKTVNRVCVDIGVNAIKPAELKEGNIQDEQDLPTVEVNIGGNKVRAIRDSGAQISVFHADVVPERYVTEGNIYLVPAVGEMQKARLANLPIALWEENSSIKPEIEILAAVTDKLNCLALITPNVYEQMCKQAALYQVSVQELETGREESNEGLRGENSGEGESLGRTEGYDDVGCPSVMEIPEGEDNPPVEEELGMQENNTEGVGMNKDYGKKSKEFRQQQRACQGLARCWEEARRGKNNYFIEDNLLYRNNKDNKIGESVKQLVVPECRRKEVLRLAHNQSTAGHLAAKKTWERINLSFYWEGVRSEVKRYCSACEECQLRRRTRTKDRAPIQPIARPEIPFQVVHADLIGPIDPKSGRGHSYVLCVVDQHSRWPEAIPLRTLTAKATCEAFLEIFMRMGVPQVIAMDNGTNFAAKLTKEFLKHLGAVPRFCTPGYPLSNGLVEKFNFSLKNMLHHAIREQGRNWDRLLPFLLWANREVPNETTGVSPFQLMFGRAPTGPLALLKTCWEGETVIPEGIGNSTTEYLEQLREKFASVSKFAAEMAEKKQADYAHHYNLRSSTKQFNIGDKVIVLIPDSTNKIYSRWMGPGVIADKISEHSFLVELPDGSKRHLHQNKLRAYIQPVATIGIVYEAEDDFGEIQHAPEMGKRESVGNFQKELEVKLKHLNQAQQKELKGILSRYKELFTGELKKAKVGSHSIRLKPGVERKQPHIYRVPEALKSVVEEQIKDLLERDLIELSSAEFAYPLVCVAKKDGSVRLCVDYRALNVASVTTPFPMQNATELRYQAGSANFITTLDILKGYWTIPMEEESKEFTSFIGPWGQYHWKVMPFGLKGSAASFQKTMNIALSKHRGYADSYIDDIIIFSQTWEEHLEHLRAVFKTLCELNFSANINKCHFVRKEVTYLGHVVGSGRHGPDPEKLKTIEGLQRPKTKKDLRSVLGLFNYYREYVENFAELAIPLTSLTRKNIPNIIPWSVEAERAFHELKERLGKAVALHTPDINKPFVIACDASDYGIGASLGQIGENGKILPITFASQKLTETQRKWSAIEREAYALIWALQKFETWVFGTSIQIYTDHNPLKFLTESAPRNSKLQRWLLALQRYDVTIHHKPGAENKDADALSRLATQAWKATEEKENVGGGTYHVKE